MRQVRYPTPSYTTPQKPRFTRIIFVPPLVALTLDPTDNLIISEDVSKLVNKLSSDITVISETLTFQIIRAGLILRIPKGSKLTHTELDNNFEYLNFEKMDQFETNITTASSITPTAVTTRYNITALDQNLTINAPTGSPRDGARMIIRIGSMSSSFTLTWNSIYRPISILLPTTLFSSPLYITMVYNYQASKWDVLDVS